MTARTVIALLAAGPLACAEPAFLPMPEPAGHYAAPDGESGGDGSRRRPWDLATALAGGRGRVKPGDTIWVRAGTYVGPYRSTVAGVPGRPVVIRAYPGERAIVDGVGNPGDTCVGAAPWTVLWGLEFINSGLDRGSWRADAVVNDAPHTKYVNLVIHDAGIAFFTYAHHADVEVYGALIFNCGWDEPTRSDGHALYLKNDAGPLVVRDNVMFNQFGYGIHAYSDRGSGAIRGLVIERNVAFNNGALATPTHRTANLLVGGQEPADDVLVRHNLTYYSAGLQRGNAEFGFQARPNGAIAIRDNLLLGGDPVMDVGFWQQATVEDNLLAGAGRMVSLRDPAPAGAVWRRNRYVRDPASSAWSFHGTRLPFGAWQATTLLGASDVAGVDGPDEPFVRAQPNQYEPGRATVVVVNWPRQAALALELPEVLSPGDSFEVRNVQDVFGRPVSAGVYQGAVPLPLGGVEPPVPIGWTASPAPRTGPDFDVFLVRRIRAAGTP